MVVSPLRLIALVIAGFFDLLDLITESIDLFTGYTDLKIVSFIIDIVAIVVLGIFIFVMDLLESWDFSEEEQQQEVKKAKAEMKAKQQGRIKRVLKTIGKSFLKTFAKVGGTFLLEGIPVLGYFCFWLVTTALTAVGII